MKKNTNLFCMKNPSFLKNFRPSSTSMRGQTDSDWPKRFRRPKNESEKSRGRSEDRKRPPTSSTGADFPPTKTSANKIVFLSCGETAVGCGDVVVVVGYVGDDDGGVDDVEDEDSFGPRPRRQPAVVLAGREWAGEGLWSARGSRGRPGPAAAARSAVEF